MVSRDRESLESSADYLSMPLPVVTQCAAVRACCCPMSVALQMCVPSRCNDALYGCEPTAAAWPSTRRPWGDGPEAAVVINDSTQSNAILAHMSNPISTKRRQPRSSHLLYGRQFRFIASSTANLITSMES